MLYQLFQSQHDLMQPLRAAAAVVATAFPPTLPMTISPTLCSDASVRAWKRVLATCDLLDLTTLTHHRPPFGIDEVRVQGQPVTVTEEAVSRTAFATLLRFRKASTASQPRVLIVAPMSGHFATLLRDTVQTMLADHDVYITDWHNARDVPLAAGRFGLDDYIAHLVDFLQIIGSGAHLVAICQPCVAALAATALMAEDDDPATPISMTLMAGPIDCRVSPTQVNTLATGRSIDWFDRHLIATVPWRHPGAGRRVYPGFVQVGAFMNMNLDRHLAAFRGYVDDLIADRFDKALATRRFYEEYLAVADLPAEFYLETVQKIFQEYHLARGELTWRGRLVNPRAIRRTALLTVEGERDDICALGQTMSAHDLCSRIPLFMRSHTIQAGAGHYGVFSGRRWQKRIYPLVRELIAVSEQTRSKSWRPTIEKAA